MYLVAHLFLKEEQQENNSSADGNLHITCRRRQQEYGNDQPPSPRSRNGRSTYRPAAALFCHPEVVRLVELNVLSTDPNREVDGCLQQRGNSSLAKTVERNSQPVRDAYSATPSPGALYFQARKERRMRIRLTSCIATILP